MPNPRSRKVPVFRSRPKGSSVEQHILKLTRGPEFKDWVRDLLVELCRIDTTPRADVSKMAEAEAACFAILERELRKLPDVGEVQRHPINPAIHQHPFYSLLHFTKTAEKPEGLTPQQTYAGRSNLLYLLKGSNGRPGQSVALNAHLDVVLPYFPPRVRGGVVYGRGACDDKGPVVAIVGALKVLAETMGERGMEWNRNVLGMFVVEEETGGNGSLSVALDRDLKRLYDSVLVCECTGLKLHPANRGAVWYRAELTAPANVPTVEMAAYVIEEMEKEGAAIRAESRHPLFPQRPVQTCHGIIGPYGEHPSRICGHVRFRISLPNSPDKALRELLQDCLESGLASYIGQYGDKTKVTDPATGKPMVAPHYKLSVAEPGENASSRTGVNVDVFGAAGHMGAIRERDGAITKMASLVRSLVASKSRLESAAGGPVICELAGHSAPNLVLEGGQGFVPTHPMNEVMDRLSRAARRGAQSYLARIGPNTKPGKPVKVTYEKLHNEAYDGDPDSPSMRNAIAAAKACGIWESEPVLGWTVSCDARIFAAEYPGMQVLTFGPGKLAFAHSDHEQIELKEICQAAEFLALFLLKQTGTAG